MVKEVREKERVRDKERKRESETKQQRGLPFSKQLVNDSNPIKIKQGEQLALSHNMHYYVRVSVCFSPSRSHRSTYTVYIIHRKLNCFALTNIQ